MAKEFLSSRGYDVIEANVAADKEARERLVEATKYRMVPTIEVDGKFFVGWNEHREEILDLLERLRDEAANN